jgi:hypothetical protein
MTGRPRKKQNAQRSFAGRFALEVPDNDLLSHGSSVLSSACCRFTVLFGMGRRGSSRLLSSGVGRDQRSGIRDQKRIVIRDFIALIGR